MFEETGCSSVWSKPFPLKDQDSTTYSVTEIHDTFFSKDPSTTKQYIRRCIITSIMCRMTKTWLTDSQTHGNKHHHYKRMLILIIVISIRTWVFATNCSEHWLKLLLETEFLLSCPESHVKISRTNPPTLSHWISPVMSQLTLKGAIGPLPSGSIQ